MPRSKKDPAAPSPCGQGRALQKIPWLRCSQPCCSAFSFLKQEATHPSPWHRQQLTPNQFCPSGDQPELTQYLLANDYQVCDLPLQASVWQPVLVNTPEQAGMRSVFSQAQLQPPAATPSLQFDPTGPVCKAAIASGSQQHTSKKNPVC